MKKRFLCSLAVLTAVLLLAPVSSTAVTTTTLLTQNFSGTAFPPTGWTCNYLGKNTYYGGWYKSTGGNGGNGGTYGSAVAWTYNCYQANCSSSYDNGTITMTTPSFNTSTYNSADSVFVDFDLWFPYNSYESNYSTTYNKLKVQVLTGTTVLMTQTNNQDFYTGTSSYTDPSSYTSSTYWKHYHVAVPFGTSTTSIIFKVADNGSTCQWGYMYDENVAFTNVVVTDVHYNLLTLNGPASINFGSVPYLVPAGPYYSNFTNSSAVPITMNNFAVAGTNAADYTIVRHPSTIPAGGKDSVGIMYTPHSGGSSSGNITFTTNADNPASGSISLAGYGLTPYLSLPFNFTSMFHGKHTRFRNILRETLIVTNTGLAPLHILSTSYLGGDYPQLYSITRIPAAIPVGMSDSIAISFTPGAEGLTGGMLYINSDASNGQITVPLHGTGILARMVVNNTYSRFPTSSFDSVMIGGDTCMTVTLSNPGSDTLAIEKNFFSSADYDFKLQPLTGSDTLIPPGGTQTIQVCFSPIDRGYRTATLRIATNIPPTQTNPSVDTSEFDVQFIGTGVPAGELSITGPTTNGASPVGKSSCVTDTFWNTGVASVTVTSLKIAGNDSAVFSGSYPALPFTLAANSSQTFTMCAAPSDTGTQTAILSAVATSGDIEKTSTLQLSVFGTSSRDTIVIAQPFASLTCEPDMDTATITVTNTGNIAQTYAASISGTDAKDFIILPPATSSVENAGQVATFKVLFDPSLIGTETANFNIAGGTVGNIQLTGMGGGATITGANLPITLAPSALPTQIAVTVKNSGTCDWTPATPTCTRPFTYVSGGTSPIAAGDSGKLIFTFDPSIGIGNYSQTLQFPNAVGKSVPEEHVTISGNVASADVAEITQSNGFSLEQNYPNPFASQTQVEITLPSSSNVELSIMDNTGKLVQRVLDRHFDSGTYGISLDAANLSSGTYYYIMKASDLTLVRQMVIVK